jgi:hypothetical protein
MKIKYMGKMLRNMYGEWKRLNGLYLGKNLRTGEGHLSFQWRMNGYKDNISGRPYKLIYNVNDRIMRGPDGEWLKVPRDLFDQVFDTINDVVKLYWKNVFCYETCDHPSNQVFTYWEGDSDYGYDEVVVCKCCGRDYIDPLEISQYSDEKNLELVDRDRIPRSMVEHGAYTTDVIGEMKWNYTEEVV